MNVELAKTAGFCFGVKRAVDTVYQQIEQYRGEKIFTYGPIIHNEEVIKDLRSHFPLPACHGTGRIVAWTPRLGSRAPRMSPVAPARHARA